MRERVWYPRWVCILQPVCQFGVRGMIKTLFFLLISIWPIWPLNLFWSQELDVHHEWTGDIHTFQPNNKIQFISYKYSYLIHFTSTIIKRFFVGAQDGPSFLKSVMYFYVSTNVTASKQIDNRSRITGHVMFRHLCNCSSSFVFIRLTICSSRQCIFIPYKVIAMPKIVFS